MNFVHQKIVNIGILPYRQPKVSFLLKGQEVLHISRSIIMYGNKHIYPWSPEYHKAIQTVSLWKTVLS